MGSFFLSSNKKIFWCRGSGLPTKSFSVSSQGCHPCPLDFRHLWKRTSATSFSFCFSTVQLSAVLTVSLSVKAWSRICLLLFGGKASQASALDSWRPCQVERSILSSGSGSFLNCASSVMLSWVRYSERTPRHLLCCCCYNYPYNYI